MSITLHDNYAFGSDDASYLGLRDYLLKIAEDDGLFTGTSTKGLTVQIDSVGRPVIGYGFDLKANAGNAYDQLTAAGAIINVPGATLAVGSRMI